MGFDITNNRFKVEYHQAGNPDKTIGDGKNPEQIKEAQAKQADDAAAADAARDAGQTNTADTLGDKKARGETKEDQLALNLNIQPQYQPDIRPGNQQQPLPDDNISGVQGAKSKTQADLLGSVRLLEDCANIDAMYELTKSDDSKELIRKIDMRLKEIQEQVKKMGEFNKKFGEKLHEITGLIGSHNHEKIVSKLCESLGIPRELADKFARLLEDGSAPAFSLAVAIVSLSIKNGNVAGATKEDNKDPAAVTLADKNKDPKPAATEPTTPNPVEKTNEPLAVKEDKVGEDAKTAVDGKEQVGVSKELEELGQLVEKYLDSDPKSIFSNPLLYIFGPLMPNLVFPLMLGSKQQEHNEIGAQIMDMALKMVPELNDKSGDVKMSREKLMKMSKEVIKDINEAGQTDAADEQVINQLKQDNQVANDKAIDELMQEYKSLMRLREKLVKKDEKDNASEKNRAQEKQAAAADGGAPVALDSAMLAQLVMSLIAQKFTEKTAGAALTDVKQAADNNQIPKNAPPRVSA